MVRFDGQEAAATGTAEEIDTDSDDEGDSSWTEEGAPVLGRVSEGEEGEPVRAVLTLGSFAT